MRLKKAYGRKKEEFERAFAEEQETLKSSSADAKPSYSIQSTFPKHVSFSDSDIILFDREAPIQIENQLGADERSEAHISKEQTQHTE